MRLRYICDAAIQMIVPAMKATAQVRAISTPGCLKSISPVLINVAESAQNGIFCMGHEN